MGSWVSSSLRRAATLLRASGDTDLIQDILRIEEIFGDTEHVFWHPDTEDLIEDIEYAYDPDDMDFLLQKVRDTYHLQHVAINIVEEGPGLVAPIRCVTTYPEVWAVEYIRDKLYMSDPVLWRKCVRDNEQAFFGELADLSPISHEYMRRLLARQIGPSGFVIWSKVSEVTWIATTVTSSSPPKSFERFVDQLKGDLQFVMQSLAFCFWRIHSPIPNSLSALSNDELAILRDLACGSSLNDLARTEQPLNALAQLCERVGATTLTQAAVIAAASGLLSAAPMCFDQFRFAAPTSPPPDVANHQSGELPILTRSDCLVAKHQMDGDLRGSRSRRLYEVRRWQSGWAVYADGARITDTFLDETSAEAACTYAAWGGADRTREFHSSPGGIQVRVSG